MKLRSKKPALTSRPAYDIAIGLLARREHSTVELARKLRQKGCDAASTDEALDRLQTDGLLSDQRFTEAYINMRLQKGYGPQRILAELRERGIDTALAKSSIDRVDADWHGIMRQQYSRKYAGEQPADYQERCKRIGYLQARGYPLDWVFALVEPSGE
jgi:regulatory protein